MISCYVLFQALQPMVKDIQAKYQSNPEVMNQKISEAYKENDVNPLAGCLPSIVQIPVFIGLYRAVLDLAKENKLNEGFLFLPSLEGPIYGADPAQGSAWLFSGWTDGAPSLGWDDTIAFLILPVVLVISQFVSMELMAPKDQPQQSNAVLKLLPLMIGWFSLNVPAALCIYWVTNNIVTTATSLVIRNSMKVDPAAVLATAAPPSPIFAPTPLREKPAGFGDGVTPITSVIDAEVIDSEDSMADDTPGEGMSVGAPESNKRGGKKKKKRRKN
jgi:YidC/Oxa1 family membrane protein insertase